MRGATQTRASLTVRIAIGAGMRGDFRLRLARQALAPFLHERLDPRSRSRARLGGKIYRVGSAGPLCLGRLGAGTWYLALAGYVATPVRSKIVGEFREERCVRLAPGEARQVRFDFRPRFGKIRVRVTLRGAPVQGALLGRPGSDEPLRSTGADGTAVLEAPFGPVKLLVGHGDRVAGRLLDISPTELETLDVDLGREEDLELVGCPEAVEPFLRGDLSEAARALERAGAREAAHRMRAEHHVARAETAGAIEELVRAGDLTRAAELLESLERFEEAAEAYLQGGHHLRAAALFRQIESWEKAAECYERAYLYEEASECYERAGRLERALPLLERAGLRLRAGEVACLLGERERAAAAFESVPEEHPDFAAARCRLAELVLERKAAGESPGERKAPAPGATSAPASSAARPRPTAPSAERSATGAAKTDVDAANLPPKAAKRYEILEELGRGTLGVVFKAYDRALRRTVALKVLPRRMAESPRAVGLFLDEARGAARLSHPNIVTVYDVVREGNALLLSMEYLDGSPLHRVVGQRGALPVSEVARVGRQMLAALGYAHGLGAVHRGLSLRSVILTRRGVVKLTGFGLARLAAEMSSRPPPPEAGAEGGPAPEEEERRADASSDLYATGACLFELATGHAPPEASRATPGVESEAAGPGLPPGLPSPLADVIRRLLAPDPGCRFQSAEEVLGVLESLEG
jgi:tetratricopeptide (TPR) repeat protein